MACGMAGGFTWTSHQYTSARNSPVSCLQKALLVAPLTAFVATIPHSSQRRFQCASIPIKFSHSDVGLHLIAHKKGTQLTIEDGVAIRSRQFENKPLRRILMTKKKQQHQDIRQETVDMTKGAAFEMSVAVLREALKKDSIRGVAAATVSFITTIADVADVCTAQNCQCV
jgi:hypothetical protein